MRRELRIDSTPIDESELVRARRLSDGMGAVVSFAGVVRAAEGDERIRGLDYECFKPMAEHQFELIFRQIEDRWPIESVRLVHRIGPVLVGEASLWVELVAPHRGEAFAASQFLIDEMKQRVPIWKKPLPI